MTREGQGIAALVTAGGRLSPEMATAAGTALKALAPLHGRPFMAHVLAALRATGSVRAVGIVGPVDELSEAGTAADVWADEGATGPENIRRGLAALAAAGHVSEGERVLLAATDAVFVHADTVRELLRVAEQTPDADIVFPLVRQGDYEQRFPGSPNAWTPLRDGSLTGSSLQVVRPSAIERCLPQIERAFAARKSQWQMAQLLGVGFVLRFVTRTLSVADAVRKIEAVTGLKVVAPVMTDARVAFDVDTPADYKYAKSLRRTEMSATL